MIYFLKLLTIINDSYNQWYIQFTAFACNFDSTQVKQNLMSRTIKVVYELLHELQVNLRLRILVKCEIKRKYQN